MHSIKLIECHYNCISMKLRSDNQLHGIHFRSAKWWKEQYKSTPDDAKWRKEQYKSTPDENKDVKREPIECLHCESTFNSLEQLFEHLTVHIDPALLNANPELICGDCLATFLNREEFVSHCRSHNKEKPFKCQICDYRFTGTLRRLLEHNARKHAEPKLNCFVCNKRLALLSRLKAHVRWHFSGILYKCRECSAEFSSSALYNIHKSVHKDLTKFKCNICVKDFPDSYHLTIHMATHNNEKKKSLCPVCGMRFGKRESMRSHFENKHCTDKLLTCALCPKTFSATRWLKEHVREIHQAIRYKCNLCDKSFRNKCHLETHLRTHSGEKPYACEFCSKKFSARNYLKTHMATHKNKPSEKSFVCKLCDKSFFYLPNLYDHTRVKHNEAHKFICDLCGKVLTRRQTLRQHMKTHEK